MEELKGYDIYKKLAQPPADALKRIDVGNLKGKSDINPQWRYEAITQMFGLCGFGWTYDVTETNVFDTADGEKLLFLRVEVRINNGGGWSEPIIGYGGDKIIQKFSKGLSSNDEAYQMALTDGLGKALAKIGVAGDIYRGLFDGSKYNRRSDEIKAEEHAKKIYFELKELAKSKGVTVDALNNQIKALGLNTTLKLTDEHKQLLTAWIADNSKAKQDEV